MSDLANSPARYAIRAARPEDLDVIAGFEVEIAVVSFGAEAITDPGLHRRRVAGALGKPGEITLVAVHRGTCGTGSTGEAGSTGDTSDTGDTGDTSGTGRTSGTGLAAAEEEHDGQDAPLGWAWMSARTNSLTGARYGNFRSLAVADLPDRGEIGELLMTAVLAAADRAQFTALTGKVHAANLGMRSLYRAFGFTATHITMEKRIDPGQEPPE